MKIILNISLLVAGIYLTGCSGGATDKIDEENQISTPAEAESQNTPNNFQQSPAGNNPGNNSGGAVNPPHGEPGHDCAIPVGAPLNSAPANSTPANSTPVNSEQQTTIPIEVNPAQGQSNNAPKTNPPHGQPGHDCAVPVGAPLN